MRGVQVNDTRRTGRSVAVQTLKLLQAGNREQLNQSKIWCEEGSTLCKQEEAELPEVLQEILWKQFFADAAKWWDNRRSKPTPRHPDFRHKESKVPLWLDNRHKPPWVDSQLASLDAGSKTRSELSAQQLGALEAPEGHLELVVCTKLCAEGFISDAVDALDVFVQRGCSVPSNLFYRIIKSCIQNKELALGQRVHALTVRAGYEGDAFLATHLIGLYASHGKLEQAMGVFSKVSTPDAYNWATIISAYARHGEAAEAAEAIRLYRQMYESTTIQPDDCLYSAVLKACAAARDLVAGKDVHAHIVACSRQLNRFVQAGLVNMYAKCGSLEDARRVFDKLSEKNVVTWTAMIAGYAKQGMGREALHLYKTMQQEGLAAPDSVTYVCLLQACASIGVGALDEGKQLHAEIKERGLQEGQVLGGSLVNMYAKCGRLEDARKLLDKLPEKSIVAWTAVIAGYAQQGKGEEALALYSRMQPDDLTHFDSVTYVCLLQACAGVGASALEDGRQLHAHIRESGLKLDMGLGSSLVNMYAKCGSLDEAQIVFDKLLRKNVVTWTTLLAGYAQQGMGHEALSLYNAMQKEGLTAPDSVTYVCLLQACSLVGAQALDDGKQLHVQIERQGLTKGLVLGGSLVNMYAKCGSLDAARELFDKLPEKNILAWNAIFSGYAKQGMGREVLILYRSMQEEGLTLPDSVTYLCLLQACAIIGATALEEGKELHANIREGGLEEDLVLGGSLVNMYAKCGSLEEARSMFNKLANRDVVTWTAMIGGYAQQGVGQEALDLYRMMQLEGLAPDSITYVCLLQACASVAALPLGEQLHAEIKRRGMQADGSVGAALVNMYAKCGSMYDSQQVFDSLSERSIEAWGALVSGYARQGDSQVVFDLLDRMRLEGIQPDDITFLSVLTVCSHAGLVDKGRGYFEAMRTDYGIVATLEHFICMIDLLGRAGHLDEALQVAKTMPFSPTDVVWHTLLGACCKWKNVEIGQKAFEGAVGVDGNDAASYVLMSNIYASNQMWEAAKEVQARRMKLQAWKKPGQSWWTDMGGTVHTFIVGDKKHPESDGIYARIEQLVPKMKEEGYVPHLESSLLDIPDDEKISELCGHSEKLAIAYALNKTAEGTTIRIVKNLRVCEDCHSAACFISKIEKRTIVCRDASRFHVFKLGLCSCGGYW